MPQSQVGAENGLDAVLEEAPKENHEELRGGEHVR
jgi:hypothetical protein